MVKLSGGCIVEDGVSRDTHFFFFLHLHVKIVLG